MCCLPRGGRNTCPIQDNSCNTNWVCKPPNSARRAPLPIVSHSPGPVGDSSRHLPPDQAEIRPDKKTNPYPPVGGGGQTNKGSHCPCSLATVGEGGGQRLRGLRNPQDPPDESSWEQHNQPPEPTMWSSPKPTRTPCNPSIPPPPRGGMGGWADRKLPKKEKANNFLSTNKGLPKGGRNTLHRFRTIRVTQIGCTTRQGKTKLPQHRGVGERKQHTADGTLDLVWKAPKRSTEREGRARTDPALPAEAEAIQEATPSFWLAWNQRPMLRYLINLSPEAP